MDEMTILKAKFEIQSRQINELMAIKHEYLKLQEEYLKLKLQLEDKNGNKT